jgi:guanylate kinase
MHDRLVKRGTETEASMKTRMENASKEVDFLLTWREKVNYRIFNDDLELSKTILLNLLRVLYSTELDVKELQQIAEPVRESAS